MVGAVINNPIYAYLLNAPCTFLLKSNTYKATQA